MCLHVRVTFHKCQHSYLIEETSATAAVFEKAIELKRLRATEIGTPEIKFGRIPGCPYSANGPCRVAVGQETIFRRIMPTPENSFYPEAYAHCARCRLIDANFNSIYDPDLDPYWAKNHVSPLPSRLHSMEIQMRKKLDIMARDCVGPYPSGADVDDDWSLGMPLQFNSKILQSYKKTRKPKSAFPSWMREPRPVRFADKVEEIPAKLNLPNEKPGKFAPEIPTDTQLLAKLIARPTFMPSKLQLAYWKDGGIARITLSARSWFELGTDPEGKHIWRRVQCYKLAQESLEGVEAARKLIGNKPMLQLVRSRSIYEPMPDLEDPRYAEKAELEEAAVPVHKQPLGVGQDVHGIEYLKDGCWPDKPQPQGTQKQWREEYRAFVP